MKFKKAILTTSAVALPIVALSATISCGPGVKKSDLTITIDQQEVDIYKPRIEAFEKATGLSVKIIKQDAQTGITDLESNKMTGTMPDIILTGAPSLFAREGLSHAFTLREVFGNDSYVNDDLSVTKFSGKDDKEFVQNLGKKYDLKAFSSSVGKPIPLGDDIKIYTEFLDAPVNGLPTGVTGWGMWIRENQLNGYNKEPIVFNNQASPITKFLNSDSIEKNIPQNPDEMKKFLEAYTTKRGVTQDEIFYDEAPANFTNTLNYDFGNKGDGKGAFKGTAKGIEAFVAAAQWKGFDNADWDNDSSDAKDWFSVGSTGQFQRENAALYNSTKSTGLWDGYAWRIEQAETFNTDGSVSYGPSVEKADGTWVNDGLTQKMYENVDAKGSFAKRWFVSDAVYSGRSLETNDSRHGVQDPAVGFWKPQKDGVSLPSALVKGQQWQAWPLAQDAPVSDIHSTESVKTIGIPFAAPGMAAYSLSYDFANKSKEHQKEVLELFRSLWSTKSLTSIAGKLQSVMIDDSGTSISKALSEQDKNDKSYIARGLFDDVFLDGTALDGGVTISASEIYNNYRKFEKYDSPKTGIDFSKNQTPITEKMRTFKNSELSNWSSFKGKYAELVQHLKDINAAAQ